MAIRRVRRPYFGDPRIQERAIKRYEQRDRYDGMNEKQDIRDEFTYARIAPMMSEFYQGVDPRRRKEMADAGMVQEDHKAVANLPERFIQEEYPKFSFWSTPYNDAIIKSFYNPFDDDRD